MTWTTFFCLLIYYIFSKVLDEGDVSLIACVTALSVWKESYDEHCGSVSGEGIVKIEHADTD